MRPASANRVVGFLVIAGGWFLVIADRFACKMCIDHQTSTLSKVELAKLATEPSTTRDWSKYPCGKCGWERDKRGALYCPKCGKELLK